MENDMIHSPRHYTQASVALEPIDILRYAPFDLGNCLKYILRAGHKGDALEDWKKADKYICWVWESYDKNPHPYDEFWKHYGLLLEKFKVLEFFDCYEYRSKDLLEHLEGLIDDKIALLKKGGVKQ